MFIVMGENEQDKDMEIEKVREGEKASKRVVHMPINI